MSVSDAPNPVVSTTPLRAYPGWVVREYRNGDFDAAQTGLRLGVTPGFDSFTATVAYLRSNGAGR